MTDAFQNLAVLSGDLVGSTTAGPGATEAALLRLSRAADQIAGWGGNTDTKFTRFRGDGWQIVLTDPALAFRALLMLFASLQAEKNGLSTRIAIGLGPSDRIPDDGLSAASGPAFEASGRALDKLTKPDRFAIAGEDATELHRAVLALAEELATGWTPEQAEAIVLYLAPDNPTLNDIAGPLGISTQAAHYRVRGAGGTRLRRACSLWEEQQDKPC